MKRFLTFLLIVVATLSVKAQDIYVGGAVGLWHDNDVDATSFSLAPEIGYNLNEKWALGVNVAYSHLGVYKDTNAFGLAPYARYSFYENKMVRLFVDGGFGFSTVKFDDFKQNGFEIGFKPGIALKLNQSFSLVTKFGFLGYRDDYMTGDNGYGFGFTSENLTVGFHYEF